MAKLLRTVSGRMVDVERFEVSAFDPRDVAHSLAMQCRFSGHTKRFYSVAEHCLYVADLCHGANVDSGPLTQVDAEFWGLMHDAAEAYIGDVARPVKELAPRLDEIEVKIMHTIAKACGLSWPAPTVVWVSDNRMLAAEAEQLLEATAIEFPLINQVEPVNRAFHCLGPERAAEAWLCRFYVLRETLSRVA